MLLIEVSINKIVKLLYYLNMLLIIDLGFIYYLSRYVNYILINILYKRHNRVKGYSLALNSSINSIYNSYINYFSNSSLNR